MKLMLVKRKEDTKNKILFETDQVSLNDLEGFGASILVIRESFIKPESQLLRYNMADPTSYNSPAPATITSRNQLHTGLETGRYP